MYFTVDTELKIIVGWSAKCGCSHIKKIFSYLRTGNINSHIHTRNDISILPKDIENYTTILIIRNPYNRLISGILDKYNICGSYRKLWKDKELTFRTFLNKLVKNNWDEIERHHFTPQTTEQFNEEYLDKSKVLNIYDINNIDYNFFENIYNKKIPIELLNFRGGHERQNKLESFSSSVIDLDISEYYNYNVDINNFYNLETKNIVFKYYIEDFKYFSKKGINYYLT